MKISLLTGINALIALLLTLLGFGSCERRVKYGSPEPISEYGCPYASFEAAGKVTDKDAQPVENIRVRVKNVREDAYLPDQYSDENGEYKVAVDYLFPPDSVDVVVTDTAGVYEGDSVRVKVEYDRSEVDKYDKWNDGKGIVHHDFQLKKK